jgi:hypothetical protein
MRKWEYAALSKNNKSGMRSIGIGQEQLRVRERLGNVLSFGLPHIVISKSSKFKKSLHLENRDVNLSLSFDSSLSSEHDHSSPATVCYQPSSCDQLSAGA